MTVSRAQIVQAAVKRFGRKRVALEGAGPFVVRAVGEPLREFYTADGVRHLYEDLKVLAGPWGTLKEAAEFFGLK